MVYLEEREAGGGELGDDGDTSNIGKEEAVAGPEHCFIYSMFPFIWQLQQPTPLFITSHCHTPSLSPDSYGLVVDVYGSMLEVLRDMECWA